MRPPPTLFQPTPLSSQRRRPSRQVDLSLSNGPVHHGLTATHIAAGEVEARPAVRAWQPRIQREFSAWVRRVLGSAAAMQRNFGSDCHFVSQVEYLSAGWRYAAEVVGDTQFGDDGAAALVDALVDDGVGCNLVLRHERLRADFARAMAWARLNVTLGARRVVGTAKGVYELAADERPCAPAEAEALLDADARQLVRTAYARDLRELEYEGEVR